MLLRALTPLLLIPPTGYWIKFRSLLAWRARRGRIAGRNAEAVTLPMAAAEKVFGAHTSYLDFDSPMGTNLYAPVCCRAMCVRVHIHGEQNGARARAGGRGGGWRSVLCMSKARMCSYCCSSTHPLRYFANIFDRCSVDSVKFVFVYLEV